MSNENPRKDEIKSFMKIIKNKLKGKADSDSVAIKEEDCIRGIHISVPEGVDVSKGYNTDVAVGSDSPIVVPDDPKGMILTLDYDPFVTKDESISMGRISYRALLSFQSKMTFPATGNEIFAFTGKLLIGTVSLYRADCLLDMVVYLVKATSDEGGTPLGAGLYILPASGKLKKPSEIQLLFTGEDYFSRRYRNIDPDPAFVKTFQLSGSNLSDSEFAALVNLLIETDAAFNQVTLNDLVITRPVIIDSSNPIFRASFFDTHATIYCLNSFKLILSYVYTAFRYSRDERIRFGGNIADGVSIQDLDWESEKYSYNDGWIFSVSPATRGYDKSEITFSGIYSHCVDVAFGVPLRVDQKYEYIPTARLFVLPVFDESYSDTGKLVCFLVAYDPKSTT